MPKPIGNQQDRDALNTRELGYISDFIVEKTQLLDEVSDVMAFVSQFLAEKKLALDVDDYTLVLKKLLYIAVRDKETDSLAAQLETWAAGYSAAAEKARQQGEANRQTHAKQPVGIYRGLTERHTINYKAWGEDLDILVALRHEITTSPDDITKDGVYFLSPVSLEEGTLTDKINEIRRKHKDKELTLLVPVNQGQNHWQLGIIQMVNGKIDNKYRWDSIKEGVQKNGYSCMDYTIQMGLNIKYGNYAPEQDLQTIIDAKDALSLREAIVNRILNVHEKLHGNQSLRKSVDSQVNLRCDVENFADISEEDEEGLHAELLKNKDIQIEFDASMAAMLKDLSRPDKKLTEAKQLVLARKFAYQELLKKYGLFASETTSVTSQDEQLTKRI